MALTPRALECLERARSVGWDLGLSSIKALLAELNNPQDQIKSVHVTGTNGKGSTCAFIDSIMTHAGYRVGRFTSPAVECEFERYTICGKWILEDDYNSLLDTIAVACEVVVAKGFRHPSVFEIETALAYLYFYISKCDLIIIEVGMGGLLDATNVMTNPTVCAFASIGLDHTAWLGDTLTDITKNKAGIIKPKAFVVSALQDAEVEKVLRDVSRINGCEITFEKPLINFDLSLVGSHQCQNAALAVGCVRALKLNGFSVDDDAIKAGLLNAKWPFRFERISDDPTVILDGAHNLPAIKILKDTIEDNCAGKDLTFVISVLADKDYKEMFELILPLASRIIVVESSSERALKVKELFDTASNCVVNTEVYMASSFEDAVKTSMQYNKAVTICFGTFTFLNDMRKAFKENFK